VHAGVDYQVRETFESALHFGEAALRAVGVPDDEAATIRDEIRSRDESRFELQLAEGIGAGRDMLHSNMPSPTPLTPPRRAARRLETAPPEQADEPR
jgi:glutathione-regulated potassium-efflux system protein KefB